MKPLFMVMAVLCVAYTFQSCGNANGKANDAIPAEISAQAENAKALLRKSDLQIQQIVLEELPLSTKVSGRVIPQNTTTLFAEVQGKILPNSIAFKEGTNFDKDAPIILMDSHEFALALEAQRSAFLNLLTNMMPDMKSDFPESYPAWKTYIEQYKAGMSLPNLPEPASEKEKYFIITYQIYSQYFNIKSQEERLLKYTIKAPYAGTIIQSNIDIGSLVSPGQPLGTIAHRSKYELRAGINLAAANAIQIGDVITFASNDGAGSFKGKLVRINKTISPETQNMTAFFEVSGAGVNPGMYLEGDLKTTTLENVAIVPSSAISRDNTVMVLENNTIKAKR
ncbi:MAG: efflux RND transporter periplasmic adaptor subunit [Saprospiraceae bacterium]|nr:efflux RND transporter periplasmic adaptor subunit [Saprospiraceae bacterium]